jgi:hypothetical protein
MFGQKIGHSPQSRTYTTLHFPRLAVFSDGLALPWRTDIVLRRRRLLEKLFKNLCGPGVLSGKNF